MQVHRKIILNDAFKGYTLDQDKIITPEETVARFKAKLQEVHLDILERTVRIDNGRLDIPVFFSICGQDALQVIGTKKQMGKGSTPQQSEASAVMELAERFSFFSFSKDAKNFFVEEYRNLKDQAIPFELITRSVHDDSEEAEKVKEVFSADPPQMDLGLQFDEGGRKSSFPSTGSIRSTNSTGHPQEIA